MAWPLLRRRPFTASPQCGHQLQHAGKRHVYLHATRPSGTPIQSDIFACSGLEGLTVHLSWLFFQLIRNPVQWVF